VSNNLFEIVFPSRAELLRMVEWGIVHSKFYSAKLKIEERMVDNEVVTPQPPRAWRSLLLSAP
jgi:hypothetical protein